MYTLRRYRLGDAFVLADIFEAAVRGTACRDYTPEQIDAWAASADIMYDWHKWFSRLYTVVAELDGRPVGYGNIDDTGYLDHLFVRPEAGGQGVASAICAQLEGWAAGRGLKRLTVHASITAQPFFEKRGWRVIQEQQVLLRMQTFTNFVMEYILP